MEDENIKQRDVFLKSEGDNWYLRNKQFISDSNINDDVLLKEILDLVKLGLVNNDSYSKDGFEILEIGCGNGARLKQLVNLGFKVSGIDPSASAISEAKLSNVDAYIGTADNLPFKENSFDIVVFGFCLYLCDREDLFLIIAEANRVLKTQGYLLIFDFFSKTEYTNEYHHLKGLKSFKMDYSKMFEWHPNYLLVKKVIGSHNGFVQTDKKDEMVCLSVFRKSKFI